ncbi:MAG: hypothetical protein K2O47_02230, partial [Muribaculaceae bacterium]|nr:hypothetical protein [Muribaculaceae bacterium]
MKYDNDIYSGDEDDDELWNDELDINTDDSDMESYGYSVSSDVDGQQDRVDDTDASDEDESNCFGGNEDYSDYYNESTQDQSSKRRRERFFGSKDDDREDENDFYSSEEEPVKEKKPKAPKLDPEDPDYW